MKNSHLNIGAMFAVGVGIAAYILKDNHLFTLAFVMAIVSIGDSIRR